jgi:hypothetical protein
MNSYAINLLAGVAALFLATGATSAEKMAVVEPALPPHFSGVWCYNKIASEEAIEDVDSYDRGETIPGCANRGGFTIWPNGGGYTFGRFDVVRNSCEFEKIDLIESSGKGEKYKARVACDNSGENADDPEDHEIKHVDLIIEYDGNMRSRRPRSIFGRPARFRDFRRQKAVKPARCHRRMVSG